MIQGGVNLGTGRKHSIEFGDGTLYEAGASDHREGQFKPTVGHTYNDWFLIPSSRPTVAMPGTDAKFITLPGRDGDFDLSEWIRKDRPAYRNRSGSFEFYVENDREYFITIFQKVYNSLHGKKFKMVLSDDDPGYYYEGRFAVSESRSDPNWSVIKIDYNLQPWKRRCREIKDGTIWDTMNFEADYDYDPWNPNEIEVSGGGFWDVWGDGYPFPIEVTGISGSVDVTFGEETQTVSAGETKKIGHAKYGSQRITFSGTGTVSVNWRGGSL